MTGAFANGFRFSQSVLELSWSVGGSENFPRTRPKITRPDALARLRTGIRDYERARRRLDAVPLFRLSKSPTVQKDHADHTQRDAAPNPTLSLELLPDSERRVFVEIRVRDTPAILSTAVTAKYCAYSKDCTSLCILASTFLHHFGVPGRAAALMAIYFLVRQGKLPTVDRLEGMSLGKETGDVVGSAAMGMSLGKETPGRGVGGLLSPASAVSTESWGGTGACGFTRFFLHVIVRSRHGSAGAAHKSVRTSSTCFLKRNNPLAPPTRPSPCPRRSRPSVYFQRRHTFCPIRRASKSWRNRSPINADAEKRRLWARRPRGSSAISSSFTLTILTGGSISCACKVSRKCPRCRSYGVLTRKPKLSYGALRTLRTFT